MHVLMGPESGTASSCERKQLTCEEAFPANTGIVQARVCLSCSHSKSMKTNNFLKKNACTLKCAHGFNATFCS